MSLFEDLEQEEEARASQPQATPTQAPTGASLFGDLERAELEINAPAPMAPEAPRPTPAQAALDATVGGLTNVAQGATAQWADELLAAPAAAYGKVAPTSMGGAPEGTSYTDIYKGIRDEIRKQSEDYAREHPVASTVQRVGGSLLPFSRAAQGAQLTVPRAAQLGAAYGGLEYMGGLEGNEDFSPASAALNMAAGAAFPLVAEAIPRVGGAIGRGLQIRNRGRADDVIGRQVEKVVDQTGMTPEQITEYAMRMGPEASLVDVTGDVGLASAQAARSLGGGDAIRRIEQNYYKTNAARDRIRDTLERESGAGPREFWENFDAARQTRRENAAANYKEALDAQWMTPTQEMRILLKNNQDFRDAWDRLRINNERLGIATPELLTRTKDGDFVVNDVEIPASMMQEFKWELDKIRRSYQGAVDSAGKRQGGNFEEDYHRFRDDLYAVNEDLRTADATYAGDTAILNALEQGKKDGLNRGNIEDQLQAISRMTPSEREAYGAGVMSYVYNAMGRGREETLGTAAGLESENARLVLTELFGPEQTSRIISRLRTERRFRESEQGLRQGSQTDLRRQATERAQREAGIDAFSRIEQNTLGTVFATPLRKAYRMLTGIDETEWAMIADAITRPGGVEEAIRLMQKSTAPPETVAEVVRQIRRAASITAPAAASGAGDEPFPLGLMENN